MLYIIISYLLFNLLKYLQREHEVHYCGYQYKITKSSYWVRLPCDNGQKVLGLWLVMTGVGV